MVELSVSLLMIGCLAFAMYLVFRAWQLLGPAERPLLLITIALVVAAIALPTALRGIPPLATGQGMELFTGALTGTAIATLIGIIALGMFGWQGMPGWIWFILLGSAAFAGVFDHFGETRTRQQWCRSQCENRFGVRAELQLTRESCQDACEVRFVSP